MRPSLSYVVVNPPVRLAIAAIAIAVLTAGCASRRPAPVEERPAMRAPGPVIVLPAPATVQAPPVPPPVPTYAIKRGDTLHQIALDNGLDYRELAAWNNIENANVIRVGQVLRLAAPGEPVAQVAQPEGVSGVTTAPLRSPGAIVESNSATAAPTIAAMTPAPSTSSAPSATPGAPNTPASATATAGSNVKTSPKAIKEPYTDQAVRDLTLAASAVPAPPDALAMAAPGGVRVEPSPEVRPPSPATPAPVTPAAPSAGAGDDDKLDWAWPAKGKIVAGFSDTANLKGIDIAGSAGQAVQASAPGKVVYAGSGLRGYGKLIIIKHNATYLSAYAHNREILVKEGQQVTRGQRIAEMGNTDADQVKLHFEIRRLGKPMDPTKYLPPA